MTHDPYIFKLTGWRTAAITLFAFFAAVLAVTPTAHAQLLVDFDGGDTTAWSLTNSTGDPPAVVADGPTGSFVRITSLTGSNNNSIALDELDSVSGPAPNGKVLTFDFRMSDNQANTDAGGCCGSAADGIGIGYFATPLYGATGGSNPAAEAGASPWETPIYASAATIGLDVFEDIDVVSLNFFNSELAAVDVRELGLDLNNGIFHRGIFTVEPDPADSTKAIFNVDIIEDVNGESPITHSIVSDLPVDTNLSNLPMNRVIAGGRTGGAFVNADLDNITVNYIPEPSSIMLLGIAVASLAMTNRRRRVRR